MRVSIRIRGSKCVQLSRQRSVITRFSLSIYLLPFFLVFFFFFGFFSLNFSSLPFLRRNTVSSRGCEKASFFPRSCPFLLHCFTTLAATATVVVVAAAVCCHERCPWKKAKKRREKEGAREREREKEHRVDCDSLRLRYARKKEREQKHTAGHGTRTLHPRLISLVHDLVGFPIFFRPRRRGKTSLCRVRDTARPRHVKSHG